MVMIMFANNYESFIIYSIFQPKNIFFEPYPKHDKATLNSCNVGQVGGCLSLKWTQSCTKCSKLFIVEQNL